MKRFVAALTYGDKTSYINLEANRMAINESFLYAYHDDELVAVADMGAVTEAHLADVAEKDGKT